MKDLFLEFVLNIVEVVNLVLITEILAFTLFDKGVVNSSVSIF